jgi:riboflavin synthase
MFTGLVEEMGECQWLRRTPRSVQLSVVAKHCEARQGDSVAVNGCCLTVTTCRAGVLAFDLLEETLRLTNLGDLKPGSGVNLERALAANARLGGHFVQGHIDGIGEVVDVSEHGPDLRLAFSVPKSLARYIAYKGSIAVNGVSLTVAEAKNDGFVVWIIPHTRSATNLGELRTGMQVNLETDILAKYVERILKGRREEDVS